MLPTVPRPALLLLLMTLAIACDTDLAATHEPTHDPSRGEIGKADLSGSCADTQCERASLDGNCWCDDECESFGDCCSDYEAVCKLAPPTCGTCSREEFGRDVGITRDLVADDDHVYWVTSDGAVHRREVETDGVAQEVATAADAGGARWIALDDTHVYWLAYVYPGENSTLARRAKSLASPVELLASAGPLVADLVVDETHVYFTADDRVLRVAKSGGAAVETVATAQATAIAIAVDETHVYWTSQGDRAVRRRAVSLGSAPVETVATNQDQAGRIALDAMHVYWVTDVESFDKGFIRRRSKTFIGAPIEDLVTGWVTDIALDGQWLLWAEPRRTLLTRRDLSAGATTPDVRAFAMGDAGDRFAVSPHHVYWNGYHSFGVARVERCGCGL